MHLPALGSVRWRKVVRDLGEHRVRSLLVVLSIAVGVMAVGTIAGANALLERNLADGYAATKPSSASLFTTVPFDKGLVDVVRRMPDVAEAEGRRSATARMVKTDGETVELALTALPDYEAQPMDLVSPESGTWPPKRGEIVFERSSRTVADLQEGRTITVQLGPDKTKTLVTGGFAHEPGGAPAYFFGQLIGYVTFDTLADLGFDDSFNELRIRVADPDGTRAQARAVAGEVRDRLEKAGAPVAFVQVPTPGEHPAQDVLNAVFLILGAIGVLSLAVSGFLVINTISAIIAQQTRQIGMMKAVGARDRQVAGVYLGIVLGYALVALMVALPMGALGAWQLTRFTAGLVNFEATEFFLPPQVLALEIAIGLLVPLAAARLARLSRRAGDGARGDRVGGHLGQLRALPVRPPPAADQGPVATHPALDPQHLPPQVPAHPDAARAHARRRRVHVRVHAARVARRDRGRDAGLLQLRRPGPAHAAHPHATSWCARRSRCRGSSRRSRGPSPPRSACARTTRPAATRWCSGCPTARRPCARSSRRGGSSSRATATRWSSPATSSTTSRT